VGFSWFEFFIDNAVLLFPTVLSLGGQPRGMGFQPLGTPFLCMDLAVACTGIDAVLSNHLYTLKLKLQKAYCIPSKPNVWEALAIEGVEIVFSCKDR